MRILFLLSSLVLLSFLKADTNITIDREEAQKAFALLNEIRAHPENYHKELKFSKSIKLNHTALIWNDTLAKAAETKAYDMAKRNYFAHVDPSGYGINYYIQKSGYQLNPEWTKKKNYNFFESIADGMKDGEDAIRILIIDKGVPSLGHRNHLLGVGEWNSSLVDIGIGYVNRDAGDKHKSYVSIIIAKHG